MRSTPEAAAPQYLTIDQVAATLAVDRKTVRRKIAAGELSAVRVGACKSGTVRDMRPIRIPAAALTAILEPMNVRQGAADAAKSTAA